MRRTVFITATFLFFILAGCKTNSPALTLFVINPLDEERTGVYIFVSREQLGNSFNPNAFAVFVNEREVASQYNFSDSAFEGIAFVLDKIEAQAKMKIEIRTNYAGNQRNYPKRTQAELSHKVGGQWKEREYIGGEFQNVTYLRVPEQHKDHSWFIRYEGPGWESDKVGYRFYLDQRNAIDVFGKKVAQPILHTVGLDGFDSYHQMQEWGMDVMKVGKSLGIGSIGSCFHNYAQRVELTDSVDCRILENGPVYSSILTRYYGWTADNRKTNLISHLSITAGSRLTKQSLLLSDTLFNSLCTGINKYPDTKIFLHTGDEKSFGYLATYGKQSLNDDNLGLVIFFNSRNFAGFSEDEFNHLVNLKSEQGKLTYYFAAAWEGESGGIKTEEDFLKYISLTARELANPVQIIIKK